MLNLESTMKNFGMLTRMIEENTPSMLDLKRLHEDLSEYIMIINHMQKQEKEKVINCPLCGLSRRRYNDKE